MNTFSPCRGAAALALLLAGLAAQANPTVTPGLWEYRTSMQANDPKLQQGMAEAQKALASMPPEQRRQMEQMLASQGISIGAAGNAASVAVKACITPEQAARQELPAPDDKCTHRITSRTANSLKFTIECPADKARGEGEVVFANPRNYDGRFSMQKLEGGRSMQMESTIKARWLSADCGSIKPEK